MNLLRTEVLLLRENGQCASNKSVVSNCIYPRQEGGGCGMSGLGYTAEPITPEQIEQLKALDPNFVAHRDMDKQYEELKALCKPVNEWLQLNYPPHTKILIGQGYAELLDGGIGVNYDLFD